MKWSNLKDKFIDLFYKEIEVEEEEELDVKDANGEVYGIEQYHLAANEAAKKDVKIRYQYPRKTDAPFRFPVIPDDEKSFQVRSEATRKPRDKKEGTLNKIMTTKTQTKREMEDIPAFMRRDRSKNKQKSVPQQISSTKNEDQKEEPLKIYPHTKPDELDAVFKKRDRKPEQVEREVEHSKEELAPNTLSNHHHG